MSLRKHNIFRMYIALAREEHYVPSELGECLNDDWDDGLMVQLNGAYCPKLATKLGMDYEQIWDAMIVPRPSQIEHWIFMNTIRRVAPEAKIAWTRTHGYLQPSVTNGLITNLEFHRLYF